MLVGYTYYQKWYYKTKYLLKGIFFPKQKKHLEIIIDDQYTILIFTGIVKIFQYFFVNLFKVT